MDNPGAFELLQAQDAYFSDSTTYLIQQNTYETAIRNLNLAMGEDQLNQYYQFTDELSFQPQDYNFGAMQTKMLANNQSLKNLFINRELANINTKIVESAKYPVLSTRAGLSYKL